MSPAEDSEAQDILMSSDGEAYGLCSPPARIAARFYRHSNSRRKSSAASSRRNSMTSLHSGRSNRSAHGGPQSTHIAQHLRRASIIEGRKARLADKAAHAEKVRLRAAMAKAAPRMSTCSEERAMAAQQAREKLLAQVAANCAEEVKRAKKVAEEMKGRKAAEHRKLKDDVEEKAAEAEKRRMIHQQNLRRARTASLPIVEEKKASLSVWKPRTDEAAARLIQRAWRFRRREQIITDYQQLGLTSESVRQTTFEEVSVLLSQDKVLNATAKMMRICGLQDGEIGGQSESVAVRVFLSTFVILGHPTQIFNSDGEQEQDLITKAKDLLVCFDRLVTNGPPKPHLPSLAVQLASLAEAFATFQTAFTAWKNHDSSVLVETMIAQFVELDSIWQTVKNDTNGEVASDYREGIQHNQTLLLVRLKRLAGHDRAMQMIKEAVRARRKSKVKVGALKDVRPRAASRVVEIDSSLIDGASRESAVKSQATSSSDRSIHIDELNKVISPLPDNRKIIHELSINHEYKIDVVPQTNVRDSINRAVFASMRSDVEAGLGDQWILAMAETIHSRLLRLVTPGKSLHILISEALDPSLIETQLKAGSFSYSTFFSFMNSILPKVCAPVRDEAIKSFIANESTDLIDRLAELIHIIDLLSLDHANFILQRSAPELLKRATEYEQRCFAEQVASQRLHRTTRWWKRARSKALTEANSRQPASNSVPVRTRPTLEKIYMTGLIDLFLTPTPLLDIDLPETLALDRDRITRLRQETLNMITHGAILLTAKNLLKRDVRAQWKAEANRMWESCNVSTDPPPPTSSFLAIIESTHAMPPATKSALSNTIDRVLTDAKSGTITHPVTTVLLAKLQRHVLARLAAGSAEERLRVTTTASESLTSGGLPEFVGRIGSVVGELARVAEVDRGAHAEWLEGIVKDVEGGD
ncbi:hypothetical protein MMC09_002075 [Bachmanniomyces sp. S44760]|nr:hypothetical protein [Bachmanniomyces sp. S44760]